MIMMVYSQKSLPPKHFSRQCIYSQNNSLTGYKLGADEQCAFLLRDREAKMDHDDYDMHTICQRMYCRSPTKTGDFRAGPALEGTRCSKTDNKVFFESNSNFLCTV